MAIHEQHRYNPDLQTCSEQPTNYISQVFFDADSTLSSIEGIDELAKLKGVEEEVMEMTNQAMNGQIPFEDVYFRRLEIIKPTYRDMLMIGHLYQHTITPGAKETIRALQRNGVQPYILSGGFNPSISMLADSLGIPRDHVFTNEFEFDDAGNFLRVLQDGRFPLWSHQGKQDVIDFIQRCYPNETFAMIGDGMGDYEAGQRTDRFVCFAGTAKRVKVMERSKHIVFENDLRPVLELLKR